MILRGHCYILWSHCYWAGLLCCTNVLCCSKSKFFLPFFCNSFAMPLQWFQIAINGCTMVMKPLQLLCNDHSRVILINSRSLRCHHKANHWNVKGGTDYRFWVLYRLFEAFLTLQYMLYCINIEQRSLALELRCFVLTSFALGFTKSIFILILLSKGMSVYV